MKFRHDGEVINYTLDTTNLFSQAQKIILYLAINLVILHKLITWTCPLDLQAV